MKSDLELIADFRNGDPNAIQKVARRHHVSLLNFFYPLTGNRKLAERLTHDVFERLCIQVQFCPAPAEPVRKFIITLYFAAYSSWLMHLQNAPQALPPPPGESLSEELQLALLLAPLPNALKPLLLFKDVVGMDYAEIAELIGIPDAAVKLRITEAYSMLRDGLRAKTRLAAPAGPAQEL